MTCSPKGDETDRRSKLCRNGRVVLVALVTALALGQPAAADPTDFRDLSPEERAGWLDSLGGVLDGAALPSDEPEAGPAKAGPWNQVGDSISWRVDQDGFVVINEGRRPMGSRVFARSCFLQHGPSFRRSVSEFSRGLGIAHLVATAITESGCSEAAGMGSVDGLSTGIMQVTGKTCTTLLPLVGARPMTAATCLDRMAADPDFSVLLAAAYITQPRQVKLTQLDPPKVAAAYNAGGLYYDARNPWRLRSTGNHIDRFVAAYNAYVGWRKDEDAGVRSRGPVVRLRTSAALPRVVATVADLAPLSSFAREGDTVFVGDWKERRGDFYVFVGGEWRGSLDAAEPGGES